MGVFSEIAMEQQNSMFDSSAVFEDDEAFELEEMESLPVPPVGTDTVAVTATGTGLSGEKALWCFCVKRLILSMPITRWKWSRMEQ